MILSKVDEIIELAKEYVTQGFTPLDAVILAQKVIIFNSEIKENDN